jgi:Amt family ammonium transporter
MKNALKLTASGLATLLAATLPAGPALAQDAIPGVSPETGFILTTFMFLVTGFLVMWMAAGFAMLEAGLVRSKNVTMQCLKNVSLFALAATMYYLVGYKLMYPGDGWTITNILGAFGSAELEPVGLPPMRSI